MLRWISGWLAACLLVSCSDALPATPSLTQPQLQGVVDIVSPVTGWLIYSETITIQGTAQGIGAQGFRLRLLTADGQSLADMRLYPELETWQVTLAHAYAGEPTELSLIAEAPDRPSSDAYDIETLAIAGRQYRTETAVYGTFAGLEAGQLLGGEQIPLSGTLSGGQQDAVFVRLIPENAPAFEQPLALVGIQPLDEVVWTLDMPTQGITGPVDLELVYRVDGVEQVLDRLNLMLSEFAG